MRTTIYTFSEALLLPRHALRTLGECEVMLTVQGMPALHRTSMTIEAEIRLEGQLYLLAMPLTPAIGLRLERLVSKLERLHSPALAPIRMLPDELQWQDHEGRPLRSTLFLQPLRGESLWELFNTLPTERLRQALTELEEELRRLDVAHNNLKSENLRWTGQRIEAIRPWHAEVGGARRRDAEALAALMPDASEEDEAYTEGLLCDREEAYEAAPSGERLLWRGNEFEGLTAAETAAGFGYMDRDGVWVIEPRFRWADDFYEGRAVVECEGGMGLIDRTGRYVLPPIYEIVEYLVAESILRVRHGGLWATFDLTGAQTSPFEELEAHEKQLIETN